MDGVKAAQGMYQAQGRGACDDRPAGREELVAPQEITRKPPPKRVTGLKLQMAGEVDDPVVIGGFPRSGLDAYVGKLVRAGHSVAVAMQDGDKERRLVEVIRVRCGVPAEQTNAQGTPAHGTL
jgi:hypothetical protein